MVGVVGKFREKERLRVKGVVIPLVTQSSISEDSGKGQNLRAREIGKSRCVCSDYSLHFVLKITSVLPERTKGSPAYLGKEPILFDT